MKLYTIIKKYVIKESLNRSYIRIIKDIAPKCDLKYLNLKMLQEMFFKLANYKKRTIYVKAKEHLITESKISAIKRENLRRKYNMKSSTLFDILSGKIVTIDLALRFCKANNYKLGVFFNIECVEVEYSKGFKKRLKQLIFKVLDYALEENLINFNYRNINYKFEDKKNNSLKTLDLINIKEFVSTLLTTKRTLYKVVIILYLYCNCDESYVCNLKKDDLIFKDDILYIKNDYTISNENLAQIIKKHIEESDNPYILGKFHNNLKIFSHVVYKVKTKASIKMPMIALKVNKVYFIEELNNYFKINKPSETEVLKIDDTVDYEEFIRYLERKDEFEKKYSIRTTKK